MKVKKLDIVLKTLFLPFLKDLGFELKKMKINGKYFYSEFTKASVTLLISLEPQEEHLDVIVLDNKARSLEQEQCNLDNAPRLKGLNSRFMPLVTSSEIKQNNEYFSGYEAEDSVERSLMQSAKSLKLILPYYLNELK